MIKKSFAKGIFCCDRFSLIILRSHVPFVVPTKNGIYDDDDDYYYIYYLMDYYNISLCNSRWVRQVIVEIQLFKYINTILNIKYFIFHYNFCISLKIAP